MHSPCSCVLVDQYQYSRDDDTIRLIGTAAIASNAANGPCSAAMTGSGVPDPTICTVDTAGQLTSMI